jgi:hypothetical protein
MKNISVFCLLMCIITSMSCDQGKDSRNIENSDKTTKLVVIRDLGVIRDTADYEIVLDGSGEKIVESVSSSCGCTMAAIHKGDKIVFNEPFTVSINPTGKNRGETSQSIWFKFEDNSILVLKIKFNYLPLPFSEPKHLIFSHDRPEREVSLHFPGVNNISISSVELPIFLTWQNIGNANSSDIRLDLLFTVDMSSFLENKDARGVIVIHANSEEQPIFRIPYLILNN